MFFHCFFANSGGSNPKGNNLLAISQIIPIHYMKNGNRRKASRSHVKQRACTVYTQILQNSFSTIWHMNLPRVRYNFDIALRPTVYLK